MSDTRLLSVVLGTLLLSSGVGVLAGCAGPDADPEASIDDPDNLLGSKEDTAVRGTAISWRRAPSAKQIPKTAPGRGQYRVHLIDVGTGLSILIQGNDFTMLYDGGSGDDRAGITTSGSTTHNGNRLVAYLFAALGPSGPKECTPDGDGWAKIDRPQLRIDHLFLSHPHEDHDSLLDDVVHCYDVKNVYDSGDDNNREGYGKFMAAVAAEPGVIYHNAAGLMPGEQLTIFNQVITLPPDVAAMDENDIVALGAGASMKILHVDGEVTQDENLNSTVVRLQLGSASMLLTGDAESGARTAPTGSLGHIEADLVSRQADSLKADILQVPHHGASTSSRLGFLEKVQPRLALIGVGPLPYSGVVLPDKSVVDAVRGLASRPTILRTDLSDKSIQQCSYAGAKVDRIGNDDNRPGGCDNYIITIAR